MRERLRRLPIRSKLIAMIMVTSATVLVLAGVAYLGWDYYQLRYQLTSEAGSQARVMCVEFHDQPISSSRLLMRS